LLIASWIQKANSNRSDCWNFAELLGNVLFTIAGKQRDSTIASKCSRTNCDQDDSPFGSALDCGNSIASCFHRSVPLFESVIRDNFAVA
jgi:hypothetical protein